tara:strand:- start:295 stop:549 length:255 start_codon:yes stop_codon:yes gene_type:complete
MNYYIVNNNVFNTLDKVKIEYALNSLSKELWVITTTETVDANIAEYESAESLCKYTEDNNTIWTGDGLGVDVDELEEIKYLEGI